jgi:hypothetical protein
LKGVVFVKGLLHGMQRAIGGETFDGSDFGSIRLPNEHGARLYTRAVNVHHTCPALAGIAPDVRAREPQNFPQELNEKGTRLDFGRHHLPVHRHGHGGHYAAPPQSRAAGLLPLCH